MLAREPEPPREAALSTGRVVLIVLGSIVALLGLGLDWFGKVRIRGEGAAAKPLFIGIGPEAAVAGYLGRVAHADVEDINFNPFRVEYRPIAGGAPRRAREGRPSPGRCVKGTGRSSL